jgi:hypothetical protein
MTTKPDSPTKLSKSEQARINGARSQGPTTADGKKKSSRNALKHGFAATENVVISLEDEPDWLAHRDGVRSSFNPQNYIEFEFVDKLASISWRQSRLVDINHHHPANADDPYFHLLLAWQGLANTPRKRPGPGEPTIHELPESPLDLNSMELVRRYQVSLDRQYRNTLLNLRQYRKDFASAAPDALAAVQQPEVKPVEEPTPPTPEAPPTTVETAEQIEPKHTPATPQMEAKTGSETPATRLPRAA